MSEDHNILLGHILSEVRRVDSKLDKVDERLDNYNGTLIKQAGSLEYHIKRTDILEAKVNHVESEVTGLKEHVMIVTKLFKIFGFIFSSKGKFFLKIFVPIMSAILSYMMVSAETIKKLMSFFGQ